MTKTKRVVGYRVKQYGATCMECGRKMGHGTIGYSVQHGRSHFYYHPACYKKRRNNQYPGHML